MTDLVGITEIARRLGTSPGVVRVWRRRHADFPVPLVTLAMGPVFDWQAIATWHGRTRRPGRPHKATLA